MKNILAETVYLYFRVYQHFLQENNLPDDSNVITVEDLVDYVENHIGRENRDRLMDFCEEAY